jgi:hypothetical protein
MAANLLSVSFGETASIRTWGQDLVMDDFILFGQGFRGKQGSYAFHGFTKASTCLIPGHRDVRGEEKFGVRKKRQPSKSGFGLIS